MNQLRHLKSLVGAIRGLFFILAIGVIPSLVSAQGIDLMRVLTPGEGTAISKSSLNEVQSLRRNKSFKNVTLVKADISALTGPDLMVRLGTRDLHLAKGYTGISNGHLSWTGRGDGVADYAVFDIAGDKIFGNIYTADGTYELRTLEGGVQVLLELDLTDSNKATDKIQDPKTLPQLPATNQIRGSAEVGDNEHALADPNTIYPVRILVAYTSRAQTYLGSNLTSGINNAIANINAANTPTSVNFNAVLAGTMLVNYTGANDSHSAILAFEGMSDVKAAHDNLQADLMVMIDDLNTSIDAGEAAGINVTPPNAYAVVAARYLTQNFTFSHEVGHLMGGDHAPGDTTQDVFRYGHGTWWFIPNGGVGTVGHCMHSLMSYAVMQSYAPSGVKNGFTCQTDPRVNYWSNPTLLITVPYTNVQEILGDSDKYDNAAVLNVTAPGVTNFHNTQLYRTGIGNPDCKTHPELCR